MKLYLFSTSNFKEPKFVMEEFEAEEEKQIYQTENNGRVKKSDIGYVSGYNHNQCVLLENNPSKAAKILVKQKELELEKLQENLIKKQMEIDNLKRYIKD